MKLPSIRILDAAAFEAGVDFDPAFLPSERTVAAWRSRPYTNLGEPEPAIVASGYEELAAFGFGTYASAI